MNLFIVAEISKNWERVPGAQIGDAARSPEVVDRDPRFLSAKFEEVIAVNLERGYKLHSFQLHRMMVSPEVMNETIIAVFELFAIVVDGQKIDMPSSMKRGGK